MSTLQRIRIGQHAVRRQRAVHRGAVRALPRGPGRRRAASGARYFDSLRGGARRRRARAGHRVVHRARARTARSPARWSTRRRCTSRCSCCSSSASSARSGCSTPTSTRCKRQEKPYIPDLDLATYGFTAADLDTEFDVGSFKAGTDRMRLRDLIAALEETYCRTFGAEYMYISDTPTKRFIQQRLEPIRSPADVFRRASSGTSSSG